jgi:hypothetical protein
MNSNNIYAVRDESTGKLVSDLTTKCSKYWIYRRSAEEAIRKDYKCRKLKLVVFELVEVKEDD